MVCFPGVSAGEGTMTVGRWQIEYHPNDVAVLVCGYDRFEVQVLEVGMVDWMDGE